MIRDVKAKPAQNPLSVQQNLQTLRGSLDILKAKISGLIDQLNRLKRHLVAKFPAKSVVSKSGKPVVPASVKRK